MEELVVEEPVVEVRADVPPTQVQNHQRWFSVSLVGLWTRQQLLGIKWDGQVWAPSSSREDLILVCGSKHL